MGDSDELDGRSYGLAVLWLVPRNEACAHGDHHRPRWRAAALANARLRHRCADSTSTDVKDAEPGIVRTGFFGSSSTRSSGYALASGRPDGDPYEKAREARQAHFAKVGGSEPTDSRKCAERIVDAVRGEGIFENRAVPLQLVLGHEAIDRIKPVLEGKIQTMAQYADVSDTVKVD